MITVIETTFIFYFLIYIYFCYLFEHENGFFKVLTFFSFNIFCYHVLMIIMTSRLTNSPQKYNTIL